MKKEITKIKPKDARSIIETRKPLGRFFLLDNDLYVGIDNSSGDAWVEEFETKEKCLSWLRGENEAWLWSPRVPFLKRLSHLYKTIPTKNSSKKQKNDLLIPPIVL